MLNFFLPDVEFFLPDVEDNFWRFSSTKPQLCEKFKREELYLKL